MQSRAKTSRLKLTFHYMQQKFFMYKYEKHVREFIVSNFKYEGQKVIFGIKLKNF